MAKPSNVLKEAPLKSFMLYIGYDVERNGDMGVYEISEKLENLVDYQCVISVAAPLYPYWPRIINMYVEKE